MGAALTVEASEADIVDSLFVERDGNICEHMVRLLSKHSLYFAAARNILPGCVEEVGSANACASD